MTERVSGGPGCGKSIFQKHYAGAKHAAMCGSAPRAAALAQIRAPMQVALPSAAEAAGGAVDVNVAGRDSKA